VLKSVSLCTDQTGHAHTLHLLIFTRHCRVWIGAATRCQPRHDSRVTVFVMSCQCLDAVLRERGWSHVLIHIGWRQRLHSPENDSLNAVNGFSGGRLELKGLHCGGREADRGCRQLVFCDIQAYVTLVLLFKIRCYI